MFNSRNNIVYQMAVRSAAMCFHRDRSDLEELLSSFGTLIEKNFAVKAFSWILVGGVPKAVYPNGNADDLYIDALMTTDADIPLRNGSRGFFGGKRRVYYSVYGRGERFFITVLEFGELAEKVKDDITGICHEIYSLAVPALAELLSEERVSVVRSSYDWSAVPFTLSSKTVGLAAYVRLNGFDRIVTEKGYEKAMEIYTGWISIAGKYFGDAVYSMDCDSLVILQIGKGSVEALADFQAEIDGLSGGDESLYSSVVYSVCERCGYPDIICLRRRIMALDAGMPEKTPGTDGVAAEPVVLERVRGEVCGNTGEDGQQSRRIKDEADAFRSAAALFDGLPDVMPEE